MTKDLIEGAYYYTENGIEKAHYCEVNGVRELVTPKAKVIDPVPSYEKLEELKIDNHNLNAWIKHFQPKYKEMEKENQQLKARIAKLAEIVDGLGSNHSVGNLGYKIKNQRHEINNRLKEIDKLKKLLRECLDEIHELAEIQDNRSVTIYNFLSAELVTKIDEVLK